jgi:hypothetical protein
LEAAFFNDEAGLRRKGLMPVLNERHPSVYGASVDAQIGCQDAGCAPGNCRADDVVTGTLPCKDGGVFVD